MVRSTSGSADRPRRSRVVAATALLWLAAAPATRLLAQTSAAALALRFGAMTAVTGLEQAMTDSLLALFPGATRDRGGNVTLTLGRGAPRRLVACPLDEVGYVVGAVTPEGYLRLRRVGSRVAYPLFDQQLEGHRVTVFGTRGPVPGVVAVKSVHLTRGRVPPGAPDPVFALDNAYVDVGATAAGGARALGIDVLAPVALTKQPLLYGDRLLAVRGAGRRAACAALAAAALTQPRVRGTVVVAFTVGSLYAQDAAGASAQTLLGPFEETKTVSLPARYPDTAVETVGLREAEALERQLVAWLEGR